MRIHLAVLVFVCTFARTAKAQAPVPASQAAAPLGTWRGTSTCVVRPSACNDEVVVYHITREDGRQTLALDGRKIVRGTEEAMGVLACEWTAAAAELRCPIPSGVWRFRVNRDSLVGELRRADSTKVRDVRTVRAR